MLQLGSASAGTLLGTTGKETDTNSFLAASKAERQDLQSQRLLLEFAIHLSQSDALKDKLHKVVGRNSENRGLSQRLVQANISISEFLAALPKRCGQTLLNLSNETHPLIFCQNLYELVSSLENSADGLKHNLALLSLLDRYLEKFSSRPELKALGVKVKERLSLYQDKGSLVDQTAFSLKHIAHDKRNLVSLAGMSLGMAGFGLTRLALARSGTTALRSSLGAFAAEGMLFTGGEMLAESALGLAAYQSTGERLFHAYATMGILRGAGTTFGLLGRSGAVKNLVDRSSTVRAGFQRIMPRMAEIFGLSLSHAVLEGQNWSDSFRVGVQGALHFAFLRSAMHGLTPGFSALQHRLTLNTQQSLLENGLRWKSSLRNSLSPSSRNPFLPQRRPAVLGPSLNEIQNLHVSHSRAKQWQRLWGESRMEGEADSSHELPAAPYGRVKMGIEDKRSKVLPIVIQALGIKLQQQKKS